MMSPPPLCSHDEDKIVTAIAIVSIEGKVADAGQEQQVTVDMDSDMASPPSSPTRSVRLSKRNSKGSSSSIPRRTSSHRPQTRRSRAKTEPERPMSTETHVIVDASNHAEDSEGGQRPNRASKRRRASVDDTSTSSASSACSSPESSPPSPKTPPPLSDSQSAAMVHHQQNGSGHALHHKHGLEAVEFDDEEPPKRCKSQRESDITAENKDVKVIGESDSMVMVVEAHAATTMTMAMTTTAKKEGLEDAGVLSPSLLTRHATRHSTRILRRSTTQTAASATEAASVGRKQTSTSSSCASVSGSEPGLLSNNSSRKATAA
ncbi:hypothetical protein BGZ65_008649 [Modicella reniformis]|uniref:Uncharacterized protein n=1 Tax=Modicella reniformis TaxID=1440133 RepID=A0A9P6IX28_9FUNG|nr:hypothetical protein BGZ65_008649 [Modicella reniformis]